MFIFTGKKISLDRDLIVERELVVMRDVVVGQDGDVDIIERQEVTETDQVTYPAASLQNAELRAELGITEVPDPVRPDERLHYVTENEDGSYDAVPRPREQITAPVWERIKAKREQIKNGGAKVGTKWFHSDDASRNQYLGLLRMADAAVAAGGTNTTVLQYNGQDINWKTMDGSFTPMTVKRANDVFNAMSDLDFVAFGAAEIHRAAMNAAENPFDYDYSAGWPEVYADTLVIE